MPLGAGFSAIEESMGEKIKESPMFRTKEDGQEWIKRRSVFAGHPERNYFIRDYPLGDFYPDRYRLHGMEMESDGYVGTILENEYGEVAP